MISIIRTIDYGLPDVGTFGVLTFGEFQCYTVERMWLNNEPSVSCIPAGNYFLEPYNSPKFGYTVIIYGGTVSKVPDFNYARSGILIHPANTSSDLKGCIGLGDRMGFVNGKTAVLNSRKTVAEFLKLINTVDIYELIITYGQQ